MSGLIARRQGLAGTLAVLGLWFAGVSPRSRARNPHDEPASAHRQLLALLDEPRAAHATGRAYLRMLPSSEQSPEYLVNAIFADASLDLPTALGSRMVGRVVNERMRRDFAKGAVVTVDGWILSVTEARLYALAALA